MTVWCVDPGAVETGLARFDGSDYWADQYKNPLDVFSALVEMAHWDDTVLVEDYSHGGAFTAEAKDTIKVLGFIELAATYHGFTVVVRHKDKRLSGQGPAARLMGDTIATLKKDPRRKDAFSALAHCVVYHREGTK